MVAALSKKTLLADVKRDLLALLKPLLNLKDEEIFSLLEQPQRSEHGRLALPVFSFAKVQKKSPKELAEKFSDQVGNNMPSFLKSCKPLGGFLNFQFQEDYLQKQLEKLITQDKLAFFTQEGNKELWLVDFASPNVAKYMNIGHLRAAVLGQALVHLIQAFGFKTLSLNHLGDWGSQFGKLLWAYQTWGKEYDFKNQAFQSLVELYVRFHKEAEADEQKLQSARDLFQKLEAGDLELKKLWESFVELSLKDYESYWKALSIKHDLIQGESFYIPFLEDLKSRLKEKKLLEKSEGAEVVFLKEDSPPCLISKRDGASTYASRDLCSLIYRFEQLKAGKNIYVTASDQKLHFQQIFEVAGKLKSDWRENSSHVSFGMYRFKGEGKMSTRKGQVVYLKDILEQAVQRVRKIIEERNPDLENKEIISEQVAAGALVFNDLMNDCVKDVDFDWSKVLDFEGRSGPFVQYSLVRAHSLLKKGDKDLPTAFSHIFETPEEIQLVWRLIAFDEACFQAFKHFRPHILARYLLDLAKEFNRFYAKHKILGHSKQEDRLLLASITYRVLWRGLEILNVPRPPAM